MGIVPDFREWCAIAVQLVSLTLALHRAFFRQREGANVSNHKTAKAIAAAQRPEPQVEENLMGASELARRLSINPGTVRRWAADGQIPSVKLAGRTVRFSLAAVLAALKKAALK